MNNKNILIFILFVLLISCGRKSNNTHINGTFSGQIEQNIYLEQITISDILLIDSAKTNNKGNFKFKFHINEKHPVFYNLRINEHNVPLLLSAGEKLNINSLGNISRNYMVSGSEGTESIKEYNNKVVRLKEAIDTLNAIYYMGPRLDIIENLSRLLIEYKQDIIKYVVVNSNSLASIYALYQHFPTTGDRIFDKNSDILYYKMVYDSLCLLYPDSPHVISLKKDIDNMEYSRQADNMLAAARAETTAFPEIDLPDINDKKVKLSSLYGKVILLDFWMSASPDSKLNNADLKEIYQEFVDYGFEVYQVSLDDSKAQWINTVFEQNLTWISVRDINGRSSMSARLYNVARVPANYLIDKEGNIVGKNLFGEELYSKIQEIL
ncbi:MAG: AhpC/TSA family protein [Rikenellaceae bacterium]|nr:AhpC/TSA family protein [Rikenellaceae bacterium]